MNQEWNRVVRDAEAYANFAHWKKKVRAAASKRLAVAANLAKVEAELARLRESKPDTAHDEIKQLEALRTDFLRRVEAQTRSLQEADRARP